MGMGMGMMQKMQREMMKIQEELAKQEVTGSAGGGAVRVRVSGQLDLLGVEIDREVVDPDDVDMLQDLVTAAVKEAFAKAKDLQAKRLSALTGGMKIPGLT